MKKRHEIEYKTVTEKLIELGKKYKELANNFI
jgi:hypothetical protein